MADASETSTEKVDNKLEDSEITTNWDECTTTFDAMDLKEDLLRGIYAYGFEKPSAIQQVTFRTSSLPMHLEIDLFSFSSACHQANSVRQGCDCSGSVR